MTITEKYIEYLSQGLSGVNGGTFERVVMSNGLMKYTFPCPHCSDLRKKERNKRKRDAFIFPIQGSFKYFFSCSNKGTTECMKTIPFHSFLENYNPSLYKKYCRDMNYSKSSGYNVNDIGFDFKPKF